MTRAAVYLRVSTDEQRESLDAQERGARQWCERAGASVVAVYRDEGVSGAEWAARAGVQQLRTDATAGRCDVVVVRDESLRVIDDETWRAVRALDDAARAAADRTPLRRARHLLVGYAVCDACGGPVATARTREGRESVPAYLCAWRRDRGPEVCTARWTRSVARLDALVLDWIARDVLSPEVVADVAAEARRLAAEAPQPAGDLDALRAEERILAATVARLTLALETAPDVPELAARLRSQSDRLRAVRRELATSARPQTPPGLDVAIVEGAARLRDLLTRDTAAAREVLALVLDGRLRVRWEGPRRPVWITGAAELRAESSTQGTPASPEGFGRSLRRVTLRRAA